MESQQFTEWLSVISRHFNESWPVDAVKAAFDCVKNEPNDALISSQKRVFMEFQPRPLPAINRITSLIMEEGRKVRSNIGASVENEWKDQKRGTDRDAKQFFGSEKSSKIKELSMRLIMGMLDGRLTQEQYIEGMMAMDKQFPGIGFREEATSLIRYYRGEIDDLPEMA